MKLSVIILNYNVRYFLEPCIQSVQKALLGIDGEIIVADNNSPDDSCQMVLEKFPNVVLLQNKENFGFAKANNKAVELAKGEYVLILNPDTIVSNDTFIKILEFADKQEKFGALGVKLVDGNGTFLPESKRGIPTPWVSFQKLSGLKSHGEGRYYADHLSSVETGKVDVLVGAFMLMKRSVYKQVGGFDEKYFMYGEDIDLSYKVLKSGLKNYYYADTLTIHYKGESTKKDLKNLKNFNEAMEIFYKDHFKHNYFIRIFMKIGIRFWYFLKSKAKNEIKKIQEFPNKVLIVGDQKDFSKLVAEYVNVDFSFYQDFSLNGLEKYLELNDYKEIIFDNTKVTYGDIIKNMVQLRDGGRRIFKIRPSNANYILGSNNPIDRGEIISL